MSITTKTGDKGETSLYTGERVKKNSLRVEVYGAADEMCSALGLARAFCQKNELKEKIFNLQKSIQLLMADFASMGTKPLITPEFVLGLEKEIEELEAKLLPLDHFIVPGDTQGGAALDLARTIARRVERLALTLAETEALSPADLIFLNRLSDYIFLLMRLEEEI